MHGQRRRLRAEGRARYILSDHLGSTSTVVDRNGTTATVKYWPYGATRSSSGTLGTDKLYTGQQDEPNDPALGLYNYKARFYSTTLGRFASVDPIVGSASDPQSWNGYAYVRNNPLRFVDPSGRLTDLPSLGDALGKTLGPLLTQVTWAVAASIGHADGSPLNAGELGAAVVLARMWAPCGFTGCGPSEIDLLLAWAEERKAAAFQAGLGFLRGCSWFEVCDYSLAAYSCTTSGSVSGCSGFLWAGVPFVSTSRLKSLLGFADQVSTIRLVSHHQLPKQFKDKFEAAGLNIEDYKVDVTEDFHKLIHGKGGGDVWRKGWNNQWKDFFARYPDATRQEIVNQLEYMRWRFGVP